MSLRNRVVVIGGGFAGIAAAARLRALGWRAVTLLDDHRMLGGRARSDKLEGITIDTGAQLISESFARTRRLLASTRASLRQTSGKDTFVSGSVRRALQFGSVTSLLAFGGLGAMEKLKLARHMIPLLAMHDGELDAAAERIPSMLDEESAQAYMEKHVSSRAAEILMVPSLRSFYAMRGDEAGLAFFLTLARYGVNSKVLMPEHGWSAAMVGALHGADHVAECRVVALDLQPGGEVSARSQDGREWRCAAAVIATPPRVAKDLLLPHLPSEDPLLAWLGSLEMRKTWTLALLLNRAANRNGFGVFNDPAHGSTVSACGIHGVKMGALAPPDADVVLAWPTAEAALTLSDKPTQEIADAMMPEVERLVPETRGHVVRARLYRFEDGNPLARPGFVADRARGRKLADALSLPVALAGDYLTVPIIEGAVASGERAAEMLTRGV